jgi:hypothetical protein
MPFGLNEHGEPIFFSGGAGEDSYEGATEEIHLIL